MATKIQLRRGTAAEWAATNPILAGGEMGVELDTRKFKVGNGSDAWNSLPYSSVSPETISAEIAEHADRTDNPHSVTKAQIGLGDADNTRDIDKPISTATQAALDMKADADSVYTKTESDAAFEPKNANIQSHISSTSNPHSVTKAQVGLGNVPNVDATMRSNHTGTQLSSTISDFTSSVDGRIDLQKGAASGIATLDSNTKVPMAQLPASSSNTASTLVERDASGNFAAGTITASLSGHASEDLSLSGGSMSGAIDMGGYKITSLGAPTSANDAINKAYADSLTGGIVWLPPVADVCLADDSLSTPPSPPPYSVVYIIGANATGAWAGLEGHAIQWRAPNGGGANTWVDLLERPIQPGDRFLVAARHGANNIGGSFVGKKNYICQVTGGSVGAWTYSFTMPNTREGVFDNDVDSDHYGQSYVYNGDTSAWVQIGGPSVVSAGNALSYSASVLNVLVDGSTVKINGSNQLVGNVKSGEATDLTGLIKGNGSVLSAAVAGTDYEAAVAPGISTQYYRGDKTWADLVASAVSDFSTAVDTRISAQKGQPNGLASLDASAKLLSAQHGSYSDGSHHAAATTSVAGFMSASDKSKLDGVQAGATANSTDAFLLSRANHTGTQLSTTISDFTEAAQDAVGAALANTATINLTYNDAGNSISAAVNDGSITNAKIAVGIDAAKIDGGLVSNTEFNYLDGVSAPIQTQLDGKQATITGAATTITTSNLTANRALISDTLGKVAASATTSVELGYVSGVTSAIQTQLNAKEPTITTGTTAQYWRGDKTWQTLNTTAVVEGTNLYYTDARVATYVNSQKGIPNGITPLDATGLIAAQYLPSFVDDVLEFATLNSLPATGESGKLYIVRGTNKLYRYNTQGNTPGYVEIGTTISGIATTDNLSEGSINLYYTDTRVATYISTQKGAANGIASLDASAKLPIAQAPTASAVSVSTATVNAEGTSVSLARADHTHAVSVGSSEATATASTTTTSATDSLINSMTLTPAAGTYLAMFSTTVSQNTTGATVSFSLYAGGVQSAASVRTVIPRPTNATNQIAMATQGIVTVNGAQAVEARWSTSAATATANQRTLTLIKLS